jgi:hypothetical protein
MEKWGAALYGDPCRECGFGFGLTPAEAIAAVRAVPAAYAERLAGASGREQIPGLTWNTAAYTSHVADNLRSWSGWLAGSYLAGHLDVPGYDPDQLAQARRYNELSLAGAQWSLRWAADDWAEAVTEGLARQVVLQHAARGPPARRRHRPQQRPRRPPPPLGHHPHPPRPVGVRSGGIEGDDGRCHGRRLGEGQAILAQTVQVELDGPAHLIQRLGFGLAERGDSGQIR